MFDECILITIFIIYSVITDVDHYNNVQRDNNIRP